MTLNDHDFNVATEALIEGQGYYLFPSVFSAEQVAEANRIINFHSDEAQAATHFHGAHSDKVHLQRRVWNLHHENASKVDFIRMCKIGRAHV